VNGKSTGCRIGLLTPSGRGAIATVAVVGDAAPQRVRRFFQPARGSASPVATQEPEFPSERIVYGTWTSPGDRCREDVVVRFLGPERVEVHCHGGDWAAKRIMRGLESTGCRREADRFALSCDPGLNRLAQQALRSLSDAPSLRTVGYLLEQFHGALRSELRGIHDAVSQQLSDEVVARLEQLDQYSEFGRHLTEPWRVVIAGRPNVGKSTLVNRLLGFPRALVHDEAGTTRDLLEENTLIDGWPVVICDTAGIRDTRHAIELQGIELARKAIESADLVIDVTDAREPGAGMPHAEFPAPRVIWVANKSDLLEEHPNAGRPDAVPVSALHGEGVPELIELIAKRLVPEPPPPATPIPFTPSLSQAVEDALRAARQQQWSVVTDILATWVIDDDDPLDRPTYSR